MMVKQKIRDGTLFYECEECHLLYEEKIWAERCEDFCSTHHACSLEITKHASKTNN